MFQFYGIPTANDAALMARGVSMDDLTTIGLGNVKAGIMAAIENNVGMIEFRNAVLDNDTYATIVSLGYEVVTDRKYNKDIVTTIKWYQKLNSDETRW